MMPLLSYLANSINSGERSIPYSLVTALDPEVFARFPDATPQVTPASPLPPIVLNEWAARDLQVQVGGTVSLEYYLWHENGRLETKKADFRLAGNSSDRWTCRRS